MTARHARTEAARATDAQLLARVASGEIGALGELYDRHHEAVRRFLDRATGGAEDVDDLVHQTFLAAARSAGSYDGRPSSRPWLIGIAVQHLKRRRQSFARLLSVLGVLRHGRAASVDPRSAMHARTDVERALARLGEAKRITFLMAEVEGFTCAEIAETLKIPIGTVWTRLHAARRELREVLRDLGAGGEGA